MSSPRESRSTTTLRRASRTRSSRWAHRTSQRRASSISSTCFHITGSLAWRSHPGPKHSVSSSRICGAIHVGRCTALVTYPIGTSSVLPRGNISCHIARAMTPWRWLTPLVEREPRALVGRLRVRPPEGEHVVRVEVELPEEPAEHAEDLLAPVELVAGGDRRVGREDELVAGLLDG